MVINLMIKLNNEQVEELKSNAGKVVEGFNHFNHKVKGRLIGYYFLETAYTLYAIIESETSDESHVISEGHLLVKFFENQASFGGPFWTYIKLDKDFKYVDDDDNNQLQKKYDELKKELERVKKELEELKKNQANHAPKECADPVGGVQNRFRNLEID